MYHFAHSCFVFFPISDKELPGTVGKNVRVFCQSEINNKGYIINKSIIIECEKYVIICNQWTMV